MDERRWMTDEIVYRLSEQVGKWESERVRYKIQDDKFIKTYQERGRWW